MRLMTDRVGAAVAWAVVCLGFGLLARAAAPQTSSEPLPPNVQTLGPQIGTRVPAFTLSDQRGQPRTLASLMGPKGLMLVFNRSADW